MKKISSKGMGKLQENTQMKNRKNILNVLIDEQRHKYKEIRETVKISNKTLSEHLRVLKPLLEREEDKKTYPHQVLYKANPILILEFKRNLAVETSWEEIKQQHLLKDNLTCRDLYSALEGINGITNAFLAIILDDLVTSKDLKKNPEMVYLLLETFVWENYKELTLKLVEQLQEKLRGN